MPENNSILYLYGFSTMLESKLINLIEILGIQIKQKIQVHVVFIHDGVIGTSKRSKVTLSMQKLLDFPLTAYSIIPDLKARGIDATKLQKNIKGIEYEDLVDLLAEIPKIVSWM